MSIQALTTVHPDHCPRGPGPVTVAEYHDLIADGTLTPDARVELVNGWLVETMPQKPDHSYSAEVIRDVFDTLGLSGWVARSEKPLTLAHGEPEPDYALVRGPRSNYRTRHPGPSDVGLLVEVARSSLDFDRGVKSAHYAAEMIAVYWIINLVDEVVEVYTQPSGPAADPDYAGRTDYNRGDSIPVVLDGVEVGRIAVNDLLP